MPKFIGLAITIITVLCVGCSTPYMVDRKRDAADIFTATVGVGVGGKARVGFLQTGIIAQTDLYGLRGGTVVNHYPKLRTEGFPSNHLEIVALLIGFEGFDPDNAIAQKRNKGFLSLHALIFAVHYIHSNPSNYNSQIEIALGLGPAIRLGFNPGELVDFLLGWFGVDIYGDDIGLQNQTDLQPEIIEE